MIFGLICGLMAVSGDLFESFMKRCADMKDSGNLLGPHGGFFDRYDSMMLSIPFVMVFAMQNYS